MEYTPSCRIPTTHRQTQTQTQTQDLSCFDFIGVDFLSFVISYLGVFSVGERIYGVIKHTNKPSINRSINLPSRLRAGRPAGGGGVCVAWFGLGFRRGLSPPPRLLLLCIYGVCTYCTYNTYMYVLTEYWVGDLVRPPLEFRSCASSTKCFTTVFRNLIFGFRKRRVS